MRCLKCKAINTTNFGKFLDTIPHHASFEELESAAEEGCELCGVFVWNARLHQPKIGVYDVELKEARAAGGKVRLRREEERMVDVLEGNDGNGTRDSSDMTGKAKEVSWAVDFRNSAEMHGDGGYEQMTQVPDRYDAAAIKGQLIEWLSACQAEHSACRALRTILTDSSGVARLLHLGTSAEPQLRLVEPTAERVKYAALSYIWGSSPHGAMTLKSNLKERLHSISFKSLPRVYRETIELCRVLDIPYLWIDALCIIQREEGDDKDWQSQSAVMGSIYANAYVTIAAAATEGAEDRLFGRGRLLGSAPPPCTLFEDDSLLNGQANMYVIPASPFWTIQISHSSLQSRGWVFQERLMSTRIIHLTAYEACWECHDLIATEHHPRGVSEESGNVALMYNQFGCWRHLPRPDSTSTDEWEIVDNSRREELLRRLWPFIVERYTARRLSSHSDILPAISAVGRVFYQATRAEYIAGLWQPLSAADLSWKGAWDATAPSQRHRPTGSGHGNPSWSWTSVSGQVYLHSISQSVENRLIERARILEAGGTPLVKENRYGQLVPGSGYVVMKGLLSRGKARRSRVKFRPDTASKPGDPHGFLFARTEEAEVRMVEKPGDFKGREIGTIYYDVLEEVEIVEEFELLLLLERPGLKLEEKDRKKDGRHWFTALAVVKVKDGEGRHRTYERYERVGIAMSWDERMFDEENVAERTIMLI